MSLLFTFRFISLFSFCLLILVGGTDHFPPPMQALDRLVPSVGGGDLKATTAAVAGKFSRLLRPQRETGNWPMQARTYNSQRFSPITQIDTTNVGQLALQWQFLMATPGPHLSTPIVNDGVMYVTSARSKLYALNAETGKLLWAVEARLPNDLGGYVTFSPTNRGVALFKDRIYLATLDAHLVALHARTGKVIWERVLEDYRGGYTATLAPLIVNGSVIVGITGGEFGIRGFIAAFDAETGRRLWKTYTIPAPGEEGSETWLAKGSWKTGGGAPWLTGSYDPGLKLVYWGTGNPAPVYDGAVRPGDNLYTNSMLAIEATTGKIKWHFQFTPHDVWDFDGANTPVLIDNIRLDSGDFVEKALIQVNKNGHFYLLDRVNGKLFYAYPLCKVEEMRVDPKTGRVVHLRSPTYDHPVEACSCKTLSPIAFSPQTGYAYVPLFGHCHRYSSHRQVYKRGRSYYGGLALPIGRASGEIVAVNVSTGQVTWRKSIAPAVGGLLATGSGLVFGGSNKFMALDARTGHTLWSFGPPLQEVANPISYSVRGKQFIAVVAGGVIFPKAAGEGDSSGHIRSLTIGQGGGAVLVFALPNHATNSAHAPEAPLTP